MKIAHNETRTYKGVAITSFAEDIDDGSMEQILNCAEMPSVEKIFITPDVHKGYTAPIGSVIVTYGTIIPELLGNDIGCGISCCKLDININELDDSDKFLKDLYNKLRDNNVLPINVRNKTKNEYLNNHINSVLEEISTSLYDFDEVDDERLLKLLQWDDDELFKSMGTLGGGNHFVEICQDDEGELYSVVHTGSRSYGSKVSQLCKELCEKQKEKIDSFFELTNVTKLYDQNIPFSTRTYSVELDSIGDLQHLGRMIKGLSCFDDIKSLIFSAEEFAYYNRKLIQSIIYKVANDIEDGQYFYGLTQDNYIDTMHNCAEIYMNTIYHFKGVSYVENEPYAIIAGSQTSGSYIVACKRNKFIDSHFPFCSHGAGRIMSRTEARNTLDVSEEQAKLNAIVKYNTFNGEKSLEECTSAYKDIDRVIELQKDFVTPIKKLTPLINIKG